MLKITHSLRERLALQFLALTSTTVVLLTVVAVLIAGAHMKERVSLLLASEISAKEDHIEQRLQRDWERVSLWSHRKDIHDMVRVGSGASQMDTLLLEAQEEGIPLVGLGVFTSQGVRRSSYGIFSVEELEHGIGGGIPLVDSSGWYGHVVSIPVRSINGEVVGFLSAQFDMRESLSAILAVSEIGETAELLLGRDDDGELVLLHHREKNLLQKHAIGPLQIYIQRNDPLARAVLHQEGVIRSKNYQEKDVFAAYRYLPRLGWGMAITLDASEALLGMWAVGMGISAVGLLLFGMSFLLSVSFATRLSAPLHSMALSLEHLGPKHWEYVPTVQTGDEIEVIDTTISTMAQRLKQLYENLEEEVVKRTKELREQYEIDKAILESTLHGVLLVDPDGNVRSVNPAAESMLGKDAGLCTGLPVTGVLQLHRKNHPIGYAKHPVLLCLQQKAEEKPRADVHWSIQDESGTLLPVNLSVNPVFDGEKLLGAVAVFRDVTEERRVEELKSEFISLASHQLRTPLSVVKWYSELLEDSTIREQEETRKQYVQEISKAGDRMSNLVDALLQAAQLESQGIMSEKKKVHMNAFVQDLGEELRSLAKGRNITCSIEEPQERIILNTDPILLHIVVQNLFSNSVKYTKSGGSIDISLQDTTDAVEILVKDTGIGIPHGASKKIFQRLFRAENVRKVDANGSGLGLYISHMIIETLGGTINFKSKENTGTTFTVRIPYEQKRQQ